MGLDMYAFVTSQNVSAADFEQPDEMSEIFYWRKHPNLHGWMERLYRAKGGKDEDFNLAPLRLDPADIDALEQAVNTDNLPETEGFFFGVTRPEEKPRDIEFIRLARQAFEHGQRVFYLAWW